MPKQPAHIILSLGSNLASSVGMPTETLSAAAYSLKNRGAVIRAISSNYHTPAFPAGNGPDYINTVISCEMTWSPLRALEILHEIEHEMGRERVKRWGQRTLDIDMVAYDELVRPDMPTFVHWRDLPLSDQMKQTPETLILPHPRMQDRAFVLVPLVEILPEWTHPVSGHSVGTMLDALPHADKDAVRRIQ
jgi:2-amino-4-hydroxy-6-hydroxymethyldihydropteridine diphosphokinase